MPALIVTAVLAAAFGIVVGVFAWRKFLSEWSNALAPVALLSIMAISAAGFFIVGTRVIKRGAERRAVEAAGLALYGRPSSASLSADLLLPLRNDPRWASRLAELGATSGPDVGIGLLGRAGVARLDGETRAALFGVRRSLASSSLDLCAGFWTGNIDDQVLASALRKLDETAQGTWIRILARALELELAATSAPDRIPGATRDAAMLELTAALSVDARAAFERASRAWKPTPDEACAAFRALADGLTQVAPSTRQILLRIAMNPEVVGPL
jgi:hypothetical protein